MSQSKAERPIVKNSTEQEIEQTIKENQALVYHVLATKFPQYAYDEDMAQIGLIGLWNAAKTFDASKSQFSTYATACITNHILHELRKQNTTKRTAEVVSLNEPINDEPDAVCRGDLIPSPDNPYQMMEILDALDYVKTKVKSRDWSIFEEYLYSGKTMQQIVQQYGISRQHGSQTVNRIRQRLHAILYGYDCHFPGRVPRCGTPAEVS